MLRLLLKVLVTFWPFLRSIVFKDRTVLETLRENRQFTILFGLLMVLSLALMMTLTALSNVKMEFVLYQRDMEAELERCRKPALPEWPLEPGEDPWSCPIEPVYTKDNIIQLLGGYR